MIKRIIKKVFIFIILTSLISAVFLPNLNAYSISKKDRQSFIISDKNFPHDLKSNRNYEYMLKKIEHDKKYGFFDRPLNYNIKNTNIVKSLSTTDTIHVPDDYTTIQLAIDNANNGDTIIVRDGEYLENINVDKSVTIKSENGYRDCIVKAIKSDEPVFYVIEDYVTISGFTIKNASSFVFYGAGIFIEEWKERDIYANYCNITGNKIIDNAFGIRILSDNNTIKENIISRNSERGIWVTGNNNLILENDISDNQAGYFATGIGISGFNVSSNYNTIRNNIIQNNNFNGIDVDGRNIIIENTIAKNGNSGICLFGSSNTTFIENIIKENGYHSDACGIWMWKCNNINILGNTIMDNYGEGIDLDSSVDTTISDNSFIYDGLFVYFDKDDYPYNVNISNNKVNNKPLIYLEEESDITIQQDAGQIILVNCNNIKVKNQDIFHSDVGVELFFTDGSVISNSLIHSNDIAGIWLMGSNRNQLDNNSISDNGGAGILTEGGSDNTISENNVVNSGFCDILLRWADNSYIERNTVESKWIGIYIDGDIYNNIIENKVKSADLQGIRLRADYCILDKNTIESCKCGLDIFDSKNCTIFHNNLIDNLDNVNVEFCENNQWDNGMGGNYWDDYNGNDGDGDGIGDTPYEITNNDIDRYPLMDPYLPDDEGGAPLKPSRPSGPTSGAVDEYYSYTTSTTDPQGDKIYYKFYWGTDSTEWIGPYNSGESVTALHKWSESGTFSVKVRARDEYDHLSPISDPLSVSMPRNRLIELPLFQKLYYIIQKLIY